MVTLTLQLKKLNSIRQNRLLKMASSKKTLPPGASEFESPNKKRKDHF